MNVRQLFDILSIQQNVFFIIRLILNNFLNVKMWKEIAKWLLPFQSRIVLTRSSIFIYLHI